MGTDSLTETMRATLDVFSGSGAPLTTSEVADCLDLGRRAAYGRLERLAEKNALETKKVGANARVWWRPAGSHGTPDTASSTARVSPLVDALEDVDAGMVVCDANDDVVWVNTATERYFALDRADVLGTAARQVIEDHVAPAVGDADALADAFLAGTEHASPDRYECHVPGDAEREERWLAYRHDRIESGAYAGGRVTLFHDVTDQEQGRDDRGLWTHWEAFESDLEAVDEYAIFLLDRDGYVQTWTPGAEHIKRYAAEDIIGQHFSTFYTDSARDEGVPGRNLRAAEAHGSTQDEGWRVRKDGSKFWAHVTIAAIRDDDGTVQGYAKVTHDMTDRHAQEQALREEKAFTDSILDNQPDIIYAFDTGGRFLRWNDAFRDVTGYTDSRIGEMGPADFIADEANEDLTGALARVFEHGETMTVELPLVTADGERIPYEFTGGPLRNEHGDVVGLTGVGRDVSDRKARERRLERRRDELKAEFDDVFDRINDAVHGLDEEWRFTYLNEHAEKLLGRTEAELLGRNVWEAFPEATERSYREQYERALERQEPITFEEFSDTIDAWLEVTVYPSENGLSVYFRDVTGRKERERDLELRDEIVETIDDGVYAVNDDSEFIMVNDAFCEMTDWGRDALLGRHATAIHDAEVTPRVEGQIDEVRSGEREAVTMELDVVREDGTRFPAESHVRPLSFHGQTGRCGVVRDVSERKARERELERYERMVETVSDGVYATDGDGHFVFVNDAFVELCEHTREELLGAHGSLFFGDRFVDTDEEEWHQLVDGTRDAVAFETDIVGPDGETRIVHNQFVHLPLDGETGRVGVTRDITVRKEAALELQRREQQLAALNNVNQVVQDITGAVIDQSTRAEIETIVCERLADSDSYRFAWITEVDPVTDSVRPRAEAGVDGYLDDVTLSIHRDDPEGQGPTGKAIRTHETQVANAFEDAEFEPWRELAAEYGYRSSAAIPIVHEGTLYGVLGLYADRPKAFEGEERAVISQLGEVVGHAIAATERKRALMSDDLVELEFTIPDVFDALAPSVPTDGTITLDHVVPTGGEDFLVYGTVTDDAVATIRRLVEATPHWVGVSFRSGSDPVGFELRVTEPPVISAVSAHGGSLERTVIEDGDVHMRIHLAPSVDVRRIIDAVEQVYPTAEIHRRRQITRDHDDALGFHRRLATDLTDRQRTTVEAAYHAGYFEWPRDTTAEEVAESIGLAPSTLHQHLRKAQRKVFHAIFSADAEHTL